MTGKPNLKNHYRRLRNSKSRSGRSPKGTLNPTATAENAHGVFDRLSKLDGSALALLEIQTEISTMRTDQRKRNRRAIAQIYRIATFLFRDRDAYFEFCARPEWKGKRYRPRHNRPEDALRAAVRLAVGLEGKPATRRSSKIVKKLEEAFAQRLPPARVEKLLRKGGFKALPQNAAGKQSSSSPREQQHVNAKISHNRLLDKLLDMEAGARGRVSFKIIKMCGKTPTLKFLKLRSEMKTQQTR